MLVKYTNLTYGSFLQLSSSSFFEWSTSLNYMEPPSLLEMALLNNYARFANYVYPNIYVQPDVVSSVAVNIAYLEAISL